MHVGFLLVVLIPALCTLIPKRSTPSRYIFHTHQAVFVGANTTLSPQSETLSMLIDPVEKFMNEENDAAANDRNADVPDDVSAASASPPCASVALPRAQCR